MGDIGSDCSNKDVQLVMNTVKSPISGHPQDLIEVSTYGRCPLTVGCMSPCKQGDVADYTKVRDRFLFEDF